MTEREIKKKVSDLDIYKFFKLDGKILQLIDIDYLDELAVGYDNSTGETLNMSQHQYVEPVEVKIVEVTNC